MTTVAAIGAEPLVRGFALAGVRVLPAESSDDVHRAWAGLPADVGLVVLTEAAAQALAAELDRGCGWPLVAVMS